MTSAVTYLVVYCYWAGQLLPLIQGQVYSNTLPPNCNPPPGLANVVLSNPLYVKFLPAVKPYTDIDNECYTAFPVVGGDASHYIFYQSRVYTNGTRVVDTYLQHFNSSGVIFLDSPQCRVLDTIFAQSADKTYIAQRCFLAGACKDFNTRQCGARAFGISATYGRLESQYWDPIGQIIENAGYPYQSYYSLPMNRRSQCVTSQNCVLP